MTRQPLTPPSPSESGENKGSPTLKRIFGEYPARIVTQLQQALDAEDITEAMLADHLKGLESLLQTAQHAQEAKEELHRQTIKTALDSKGLNAAATPEDFGRILKEFCVERNFDLRPKRFDERELWGEPTVPNLMEYSIGGERFGITIHKSTITVYKFEETTKKLSAAWILYPIDHN